jgi:hypothetical protein
LPRLVVAAAVAVQATIGLGPVAPVAAVGLAPALEPTPAMNATPAIDRIRIAERSTVVASLSVVQPVRTTEPVEAATTATATVRTGPTVKAVGSPWSPRWPGRILDAATVTPLPAFGTLPFKTSTYALRTLEWPDLPLNGRSIPKLSTPPNADAEGIQYKVVDGKNYYSPGNIADDGLRFVDAYVRTGDPTYLKPATIRARKLVTLGHWLRGGLYFPYSFDYPNERLVAPWYSAYSQGLALSFFVRLYRATGDWQYMETARSIAVSFRQVGTARSPGGSTAWIAYVPSGYLWLEEYPQRTPTHVLNGFNFALFGLYDYERLTRDPTAAALLQGALLTMRAYATAYRVPGGISYYDLVHKTQHAHYHTIHIWQLADLGAISGDAWFGQLSALFAADHA